MPWRPEEGVRSLELDLQIVVSWAAQYGCWGHDSGLQQDQQVLSPADHLPSPTELSFKGSICMYIYVYTGTHVYVLVEDRRQPQLSFLQCCLSWFLRHGLSLAWDMSNRPSGSPATHSLHLCSTGPKVCSISQTLLFWCEFQGSILDLPDCKNRFAIHTASPAPFTRSRGSAV